MNAYVLDASVAAKWYLPARGESLVPQAVSLLEEYAAGRVVLAVPDLFWPELGNILWKAARVGRMTRKAAEKALESICEQSLITAPSRPLLKDALTVANAFDRTVYDSIYVALALATNRVFVTADERLANALGTRLPVRWLGAAAI